MKYTLLTTFAFAIIFSATMAVAQAEPVPLCDPSNKNCTILPPSRPGVTVTAGSWINSVAAMTVNRCYPDRNNCNLLLAESNMTDMSRLLDENGAKISQPVTGAISNARYSRLTSPSSARAGLPLRIRTYLL